ncbi:MAG: hypothetical protein HQK76_14135 [Desulfobacterales bacterium]|nr:hypothetical protein [Desulfobacterales bacterium]
MSQIIHLIISIIFLNSSVFAQELYIFYPNNMRPQIFQKKMGDVSPNLKITAFGRYKDFIAQIEMSNPEAIITKQVLIEEIENYSIKLEGSRDGANTEPYVLLAVDKQLDLKAIQDKQIGMLDILGRKGMKKFITNFFDPPPKLQRVSKIEDLLPLLTFDMAQGILIPEAYISYFKNISNLNFIVTQLPKVKVEIVCLAIKKGADPTIFVQALKNMDAKTRMALLEVDNWIEQ